MSDLAHPRAEIRTVADIDRLSLRLFSRWTIPRVDIHVDSLPAVAVQLAQHRFAHIAEAGNIGLGVVLASTTTVAGIYLAWTSFHTMIWTPLQFWQRLGLIALLALYAGLLGKGIGVVVQRVKLLRVLRGLRRRMRAGNLTHEPAPYTGRISPDDAVKSRAVRADEGLADEVVVESTVLLRPRPPKVLVRNATDVKRLLRHLLTHWKLPRVQISVDGVATLDVQRAQHRIALLSEACHCVLGASLAGVTLLGGAFVVEWLSSHNWDWWVPESWGALGLVPGVALCAASIGVLIEMIWTRVKLVLVVHGVRHRLPA